MTARRNKFGNVATVVDGIRFASKAEAKRYGELVLLERARVINLLNCHPRFDLKIGAAKICTYVGDFAYTEADAKHPLGRRAVVEDTKGFETKDFKIKWALVKALYPTVDFRIVKARA